jgi:hypothetical protein
VQVRVRSNRKRVSEDLEWILHSQTRVGPELAAKMAGSPHGSWHLANSPALAIALPNACFDSRSPALGRSGTTQLAEPPDADSHVPWRGGGTRVIARPMPIQNIAVTGRQPRGK